LILPFGPKTDVATSPAVTHSGAAYVSVGSVDEKDDASVTGGVGVDGLLAARIFGDQSTTSDVGRVFIGGRVGAQWLDAARYFTTSGNTGRASVLGFAQAGIGIKAAESVAFGVMFTALGSKYRDYMPRVHLTVSANR
jgi:hypothetical protein